MNKQTMMTEGVIWKKILFFSIPLILGNLFQQLYNCLDCNSSTGYWGVIWPGYGLYAKFGKWMPDVKS